MVVFRFWFIAVNWMMVFLLYINYIIVLDKPALRGNGFLRYDD